MSSGFAKRLHELRMQAKVCIDQLLDEIGIHPRRMNSHRTNWEISEDPSSGHKMSMKLMLDGCEAMGLDDAEIEELVARRLSEQYGCGDSWEMWELPAARVIQELSDDQEEQT